MKTNVQFRGEIISSGYCITVCELNKLIKRAQLALETNYGYTFSTKVINREIERAQMYPVYVCRYTRENANQVNITLEINYLVMMINFGYKTIEVRYHVDNTCPERFEKSVIVAQERANAYLISIDVNDELLRRDYGDKRSYTTGFKNESKITPVRSKDDVGYEW